MSDGTKALGYAIHDVMGGDFLKNIKLVEVVELLEMRGYAIMPTSLLSESYREGYSAGREDTWEDFGRDDEDA